MKRACSPNQYLAYFIFLCLIKLALVSGHGENSIIFTQEKVLTSDFSKRQEYFLLSFQSLRTAASHNKCYVCQHGFQWMMMMTTMILTIMFAYIEKEISLVVSIVGIILYLLRSQPTEKTWNPHVNLNVALKVQKCKFQ